MDFHVRVNSSLLLGLGSGAAVTLVLAGHLPGFASWAYALCPHSVAVALQGLLGRKQQSKAGCPFQPAAKRTVTASASSSCCGSKSASSAAASAAAGGEEKGVEEERAAEREAFWFKEGLTEVFRVETALKSILFDARSDFQRVQVIETEQFGRTLVMDGQTQSAEADEHIYHESLVHPAMLLHPTGAKKVFIGGGGEFATAREVLRHTTVERCVMVDIDKVACDICREQLPEWNGGAYEDPRFHVEYSDAKAWLEETDEKFDVIIMDICDPIEAGPGYKLYTSEFYTFLQSKLNEGGIFVTQSGPGAVYNAKEECFTVIHNTLASAFDVVIPYASDVPSFGCNWGFNLAFATGKDEDAAAVKDRTLRAAGEAFDAAIAERVEGGAGALRFLDSLAWRGMMGLPKEIRASCDAETRVMTIDNPVFMYSS